MGEGSASAQDQHQIPTTPCPPDLRGKYVIYYMEGQETPPPVPDKDTVIIRITAEGDQEFEEYWPRTRWADENRIADIF